MQACELPTELAEALVDLGVNATIAMILSHLAANQTATAHEIETLTGLRQPQVSNALSYMAGQGWLDTTHIARSTRGRPMKRYTLKKPITEIADGLYSARAVHLEHEVQKIRKLKQAAYTAVG